MTWERLFLAVAALYNVAWAAVLLVAPEWVFAREPPFGAVLAGLVGLVGLCFAVTAVRPAPRLLALGLLAKVLGPAVFVALALLHYVAWSSWPLTITNDVMWIPALVVLWRRGRPW